MVTETGVRSHPEKMSLANCCITRLIFENVAIPTGFPSSSTTGRREIRRWDITLAASTTSVSGCAVCTGLLMWSRIGDMLGSSPAPTQPTATSQLVMMPSTTPFRTTTSEPTSFARIRLAASATLSSDVIVSTGAVIISSRRISAIHASTRNSYHARLGIAPDEAALRGATDINSRLWNTDRTRHMYIILMIALVLLSAVAIGVAVANIDPI